MIFFLPRLLGLKTLAGVFRPIEEILGGTFKFTDSVRHGEVSLIGFLFVLSFACVTNLYGELSEFLRLL